MRNPLKALYEAYEQRLVVQLTSVQNQAEAEAYAMFLPWWEERARAIAEAGAQRHHAGELDELGLEMTLVVVRSCGQKLAAHVRTQSAATHWARRAVPRIGGLRESVIQGMNDEPEDIAAMFEIVAGYGINPSWVRSHFAV